MKRFWKRAQKDKHEESTPGGNICENQVSESKSTSKHSPHSEKTVVSDGQSKAAGTWGMSEKDALRVSLLAEEVE